MQQDVKIQPSTDADRAGNFHRSRGGGRVVTLILIFLLRTYKVCLSPLLPSACRFYPTCSEYMLEAVRKHGAVLGVWLGLRRLGRCHPFHAGGYDPVA